ncbi:hypothetical protein VB620_01025 [Nodularia harveyana UHCC-0300]|uniref:Uncharacterized protein n=1 Tax=Nodularia harveyana UHCC-0300 TaxID=2974287 RepID=A0ABU5U8R6_9CYAN|nr:hypothetical protein [Nodularia harveyana]MEA5579920.1 hypothetical protein [Nodularia harveyana UHCC-0300]
MYTYPNLTSILSSLSSLTVSELKVLQENIDAIITTKNGGNNQINVSHTSEGYISIDKTLISPEIYSLISISLNPAPMDNLGLFIEKLEQLKNPLNQKSPPVKKPERPLGVWKGKVKMTDDFDELSSDILSEFGMEE